MSLSNEVVDLPDRNNKTICAPSTFPGGAISIIRVSGENAVTSVDKMFLSVSGRRLTEYSAGNFVYGRIIDEHNEILDEVIINIYRAPHSYTGEDVIEISCHGSSYIQTRLLELLLQNGCVMAQPGEFTKRAFLNGKMDLSQAEAVADLIASTTKTSHRMAMRQMRGDYSKSIIQLRDKLLHIASMLELELDFSDHEELEFANRSELSTLVLEAMKQIKKLCKSFKLGNVLKKGLPITIIGETNVGKSTLLNAFLNEERALVSDIHGTTRDTVEECLNIGGILVRFIDTAGIRDTDDAVEKMGIRRTYEKIDEAEIIIWVLDATRVQEQYTELIRDLVPHLVHKRLLVVVNKIDLVENPINLSDCFKKDFNSPFSYVQISAKTESDVSYLKHVLQDIVVSNFSVDDFSSVIVSNARHFEALSLALDSLNRVNEGLSNNISSDFIAQDLRDCLFHLGEIVGEINSDDILNNIFRNFCIGK